MTSRITDAIDRYVQCWNQPDDALRRDQLAAAITETCTYTDPNTHCDGSDALHALIGSFWKRSEHEPRMHFDPPQSHHDTAYFTWQVGPPDSPPNRTGRDVVLFADDGRIRAIYGFFDDE